MFDTTLPAIQAQPRPIAAGTRIGHGHSASMSACSASR